MTDLPVSVQVLGILRALLEVAGYSLLGQGALALLAGRRRHENPVYRIFAIITAPVVDTVRTYAPRWVHGALIPPLAFLLVFILWLLSTLVKRMLCVGLGC